MPVVVPHPVLGMPGLAGAANSLIHRCCFQPFALGYPCLLPYLGRSNLTFFVHPDLLFLGHHSKAPKDCYAGSQKLLAGSRKDLTTSRRSSVLAKLRKARSCWCTRWNILVANGCHCTFFYEVAIVIVDAASWHTSLNVIHHDRFRIPKR